MALKQKIYETEDEKKKDFWLGVGLFFLLNILMALCSWAAYALIFSAMSRLNDSNTFVYNAFSILSTIIGCLPLLINALLIIYFASTRSQIALGMLTGFGIAFLITICLGVIFTVWCFYALSNSSI